MKRSLLVFFICLGSAAAGHAERFAIPVLVSAPARSIVQNLTGSIDDLSIADAAKGLRSEIIVTTPNGEPLVLIVKATTTIYDPDWKPTVLTVLQKKDRVKVKYVTNDEGLAEALSLKQLK